MTVAYRLYDGDAEPEAMEPMSPNLSDRMTVLEVSVGTSLWAHGKVKIPRDALTRVCNELRESFGDDRSNLLSSTTYGQFYSGQVGVPVRSDLPAADQVARTYREARQKFQEGPEDYQDATCI